MKESDKKLLGDKKRRRFFRHACDASLRGAFEYDKSDKWSSNRREGYLKSDAVAQSHLPVLNISSGGIALVSQYAAVKGAIISIKVTTAFNTTICAKARVKWSRPIRKSSETHAIGCEFVEISRADTRNLKDLLKIFEQSISTQKTTPDEA
jgi:hypothetical protein